MKKLRIPHLLLLLGMALMIPFYLFTAGNTLLAPWALYGRNRLLLAAMTALSAAGLVLMLRAADRHEAFFVRHERAVLAGIAVFYFIAQLLTGVLLRHTPITDAEQCFTAAQLLVDTGTYGDVYRYWEYFTRCPHNLGLVYLLAGVFRFCAMLGWTDRYMQAVLLGALLFVPGILAAARVCRRIGGVKAQTRLLALLPTCLPLLYATAELYTDAFALSFPAIVIYCAMRVREAEGKGKTALWTALFALASFTGVQVRQTTVIAVVACAIWLLLAARPPRVALVFAALAAAFVIGGGAIDAQNARHLTREAIDSRKLPTLHYIAMGLPVQSDEGYGQYGEGGWLLFTMSFDDPEERDAALLEEVIDRVYYLRYPNRLLHMMSRKNLSTFGDGTFGLSAMIEADEREPDNALKQVIYSQGAGNQAYYYLCTGLFAAQMLLACAACAQALRHGDASGAPVFIALVGIFLFLCIWETQPRYFFQYQPLLLCAASLLNPYRPNRRSL